MNQMNTTPLIHSARKGCLSVVEFLVEKGIDMEAKDKVSDQW